MKSLFNALWQDESGQGLTEYALLIALVSLGLFLVLGEYRDSIGEVFNQASSKIHNAGIPQVGS
jgi:Flp pilus assembly pilin Flp